MEETPMKTFTSLSDLDKRADGDPAKPVVRHLLEWLIAENEWPNFPCNPDDHGYIALVEPGDVDRELTDIEMPRVTDILWEGVSIIDGFYHAVYLGAATTGSAS
jgi:hypothetical protein